MKVLTLPYASHPTQQGLQVLEADLYLPERDRPTDLITWMHSGGFRSGTRAHRSHAKIARIFGRHGYAMAFIDYRLARPGAVLRPESEAKLPALVADAEAAGEEMHPTFYGPRALAVVEDCCAFLRFASERAAEFNLSGRMILGGSSAGAISALNTLYLAGPLELERPAIAAVLAFSGGFAYPSFLTPTGARIIAQHSPRDQRVPVSSIRRFAERSPDEVRLTIEEKNEHGALPLTPDESLRDAIRRIVDFDREAAPRRRGHKHAAEARGTGPAQ